MSSVDEFLDDQSHHAPVRRPSHPTGMEPGVKLDPSTGNGEAVVAVSPGQVPEWGELLGAMGFHDVIDVLDVTEVRAWGNESQGIKHYVKARVRRRRRAADQADVDALCKQVARHRRPKKSPKPKLVADALVVGLADWQLGKKDGDGLQGTVDRALRTIDLVAARLRELRPARLVVACMGDLVEQCDGAYAMQTFSVEIDRRRQVKLGRRLLVKALQTWAPLAPEVVVPAVPGNHGENRRGGKAFTTFGDNDDLALVEQVGEILAANPDTYGHVSFQVPGDDLTVTLDVFGQVLGLAHGHQARGGGPEPQRKLMSWWKDCAHSRHPIGDADVLLTGHYHHLQVVEHGRGRLWVQCPSLDGGSTWWEEKGGAASVAGTVTFTLGAGGFDSLKVLR